MNKIFLIGNLTSDPELKRVGDNIAVCTFNIAVNRMFTDSNGERKTDFFKVKVWRGMGESCAKYLKKGKKVAVVGPVETRTYEGDDGVKRTAFEVVATDVEFLSSANSGGSDGNSEPQSGSKRPTLQAFDDDGDIPF